MILKPVLTIDIEKTPVSGNRLWHKHWRQIDAYKKAWREALQTAIDGILERGRTIGLGRDDLPVQADEEKWLVRILWVSKAPPTDTHPNCCLALKPILDLLVRGHGEPVLGLIAEDDDEHLLQDIRKEKGAPGRLSLSFFRMLEEDGRPVAAPKPRRKGTPRTPKAPRKAAAGGGGNRRQRETAAWHALIAKGVGR